MRQLETFVTTARTESFTEAAAQLNLTQAAVSQQIKKLELQVGHRLFERSSKSVALTAEGEILLPFATKILTLEQASIQRLSGLDRLRGKVRLGVSEEIASCGLPMLLAKFRQVHPLVHLDVQVGLTAPQLERLESRELDLVVGKRCGNPGNADVLWSGALRWAGDEALVPADRPIPLALFSEACVVRKATLIALEEARMPYEIVFTSSSFSGLRAAAKAGFAVTVLPSDMFETSLSLGSREASLPPLPDVSYMLFHGHGSKRRPAVKAIAEIIHRHGRAGLLCGGRNL